MLQHIMLGRFGWYLLHLAAFAGMFLLGYLMNF